MRSYGTALAILLTIVALSILLRETGKGNCIFTCSTFFDFKSGDRWDRFCKAMDSLQEYHSQETLSRIDTWVVINEWSPEGPKDNWALKMRERYPHVIFIQKSVTQKGQAHTLNMCLRKVRGYKYWIHWEEAWEVRKEFLEDAFKAMETSDITQLQFTYNNGTVNWMDVDTSRIQCSGRICRIAPAVDTKEYVQQSPYKPRAGTLERWPLYSLLPSINRVTDYESLGEFNEDPKLWPIKFEWDFARRWWRAGCKKAVLEDGPVWRPGKHMSTYA